METRNRKPFKCKRCGKPMGMFVRPNDPKARSLKDLQYADWIDTVMVYQCKNASCENYRGQNEDALHPLFLHLLGYDTELTKHSGWDAVSEELKSLWDKCCEREGDCV